MGHPGNKPTGRIEGASCVPPPDRRVRRTRRVDGPHGLRAAAPRWRRRQRGRPRSAPPGHPTAERPLGRGEREPDLHRGGGERRGQHRPYGRLRAHGAGAVEPDERVVEDTDPGDEHHHRPDDPRLDGHRSSGERDRPWPGRQARVGDEREDGELAGRPDLPAGQRLGDPVEIPAADERAGAVGDQRRRRGGRREPRSLAPGDEPPERQRRDGQPADPRGPRPSNEANTAPRGATSESVRVPAGFSDHSRSSPRNSPDAAATASRATPPSSAPDVPQIYSRT